MDLFKYEIPNGFPLARAQKPHVKLGDGATKCKQITTYEVMENACASVEPESQTVLTALDLFAAAC